MTDSKAKPASVTLAQVFNPDWKGGPDCSEPTFVHKVMKTENTLRAAIGVTLKPEDVQRLIDDGIKVTIS